MELFTIAFVAFIGSMLTFFSGFGLGTILLPAFGLFFSIEIAIAMTAIVHFSNNIFKFVLVGKNVNIYIFKRFGIITFISAFIGAYFLNFLSIYNFQFSFNLFNHSFLTQPIKVIIAFLMLIFALIELIPFLEKSLKLSDKHLPYGAFLSGFFGGLSGHQGALRSAFLIKTNLTKEEYIATGTSIAILIDITRLTTYSTHLKTIDFSSNITLILSAIVSAFIGALLGNIFLKKISISYIKNIVGIMLILIAILIGFGLI
ncbi:MAG: sulfite exporter TauE/SafE family protein [Candidatus Kapabacteria bacterium]|nr:sulfite exporter TauE/SafE family protein [Candidatus Kapabacteria bacterium]